MLSYSVFALFFVLTIATVTAISVEEIAALADLRDRMSMGKMIPLWVCCQFRFTDMPNVDQFTNTKQGETDALMDDYFFWNHFSEK